MKKIVVASLFLLMTVFAASQTYTIGTGTATTYTMPYNGSYNYGWSKTVYTQAELLAAGMTNATFITDIGFNVANTPSNYIMNDQRVYIRHTTQTSYGTADLSYPDPTQFSLAWQGSITYNGSGWKTIHFTTLFYWNGTSNIELLFENRDGSNATGYPTFRFTSTSTNYMTVHLGGSSWFPTTNGARSYYRANIQFTCSNTTNPPTPATLVSPANSAMGIDPNVSLNWSSGGGYTAGYKLYVGTDNPPTNLINNQDLGAVTSYDPTPDFNFASTYFWKIVPYNSIGEATNCPVWSFITNNYFAGGNGTESNPWKVSTADQLNNTRDYLGSTHYNKFFIQTADIDLGVAPWNQGTGWEPVGNSSAKFYGNYNGNGHTITGLYINRSSSDYQGLFGATQDASIRNLGLVSVSLIGRDYVGGTVGYVYSGANVENCYVTGTINGQDNIGGLCGYAASATVQNSYSSATVNGVTYAGGFVGYLGASSIVQNCYSTGEVTRTSGTNTYFGAFCGYNYSAKIYKSYALGKTRQSPSGTLWTDRGFLGGVNSGASTYQMNGNFFCTETSGATTSQGSTSYSSQLPIGLEILQMQHLPTYTNAGWDFTTTWYKYPEYDMYPMLKGIKDFYAGTTSGYAPMTVIFRENSGYANTTSWAWNFGDGSTSTAQNPSHQYASAGTFSVTLTASNGQQAYTITKPNYVTTTGHQTSFQLISPSSFTTDMDVYPKFEWGSLELRDPLPFHYKVYIATNPTFTPESTVIYSTPNSYLYPPKDLKVNTTYFWKVIACFEDSTQIVADMGGQAYWMLTTVPQTSQTFPMINGMILDNRTLRKENSPYWLNLNPSTSEGKDLTIEAGVVLRFNSNIGLTLRGNIYSNGAAADSVLFTGYNDTTFWSGINITYDMSDALVVNDTIYVSGCIINRSIANNVSGTFLNCPNTNIFISNSRFSNVDRAVNCGASSYIYNSRFTGRATGTGTGIAGGLYFAYNTITSFYDALNCSPQAIINNTQVFYNRGFGVTGGIVFNNCSIRNNTSNGIICNANAVLNNVTVSNNGGYGVNGGSQFVNCTITNNGGYGVNGGSQFVNCTITNNGGYGITCSSSATLTSVTVTGNNGNGVTGGTSFIDCLISNNVGYGISCNPAAILNNCTISNHSNYAINGGRSFIDCEFINNRGTNTVTVSSPLKAIFSSNLFQNNISTQGLISVTADSLSFVNNDLISNNANTTLYYMLNYTVTNQAVFTSNEISQNICQGMLLNMVAANLTFTANNFVLNQINGSTTSLHGFKFTLNTHADLEDNQFNQNSFRDNLMELAGLGTYAMSGNVFNSNAGLTSKGFSIVKCSAAEVLFNYNTISNSQLKATSNGKGAIWANSGTVDIDRNTLTNNSAANKASVVYIESACLCSITKNLITYNTGEFAIWGDALTIQDNNIYNNKNSSNVDKNIRHTTSANKNYIYDFWGTRSDQGNINPTLYHNNYDPSLGVITYQPIRTAPSPYTPGQLSIVNSVIVTTDGQSLTPNTVGVFPNSYVNLCLIGVDGNAYSLDVTELNVTNMTTGFPLQPFVWETGVNTGIFRGTIFVSETEYNPQQNILSASIGDTLRIQSTVDPTKVCFIPVIESTPIINLPSSFTFVEDGQLVIDMTPFVSDPEGDVLTISAAGNQNVTVSISGLSVTLGALANWNGSEQVTFTVNDNATRDSKETGRSTASDVVSIIVTPVNDAPVISLPTSVTFAEDGNLVFNVAPFVSDVDNTTLTVTAQNSAHINVVISGLSATLTSAANWNGNESLSFSVSDGSLNATDQINVIVTPVNDAPTINLPDSFTFAEDGQLVVNVANYASDIDGNTLTVTATGNQNVTVSISGMSVTLGALANWSGTEQVTFTVNDNTTRDSKETGRSTASDVVSIIVTPVNDAPVISLPTSVTFAEDGNLVFNVAPFVSDVDNTTLTVTAQNSAHINVVISGLSATLTSAANWNGNESLSFSVSDGSLNATDQINVIVTPVNDAPVINLPASLTFAEDGQLVVNLADYASDIDGNTLTVTATGNQNVTVSISGMSVTLGALTNWSGTEQVTFTVNDNATREAKETGRSTASDVVSIIVTPVNDAPVINLPASVTFVEDGSLVLNLSSYVSDVDNTTLTVTSQNSAHVNVVIAGLNATLTSTANWNGNESLSFTVTDGSLNATDQVSVIVTPVNDAPVINLPASLTFAEDGQLVVNLADYASDIDGNTLTVTATGNQNVTVSISGMSVTLGALTNWSGTEQVTFTVNDNATREAKETGRSTASDVVSIIVTPVNDAPVINLPTSVTFEEDGSLVLNLSTYVSDVDNTTLTVTSQNSAHINVVMNGLSATLTSAADWSGDETLSFTVSDGSLTATDQINVIVTPVNDAPSINLPDSFTFSEDGQLVVNLADYASDIDGNTLTVTATGNQNVTVIISGMSVTLGALANWNGTEQVTFTVNDNMGRAIASDTADIIVVSINDAPVINGFTPTQTTITSNLNDTIIFNVIASDIDSQVGFSWFVNDVNQNIGTSEFTYQITQNITYVVKVVVADEISSVEQLWTITVSVGIDDELDPPEVTRLYPGYPNPFNPEITLRYSMATPGWVNVSIYDTRGGLVKVLKNSTENAGEYNLMWNGRNDQNEPVSSGLYFVKMHTLQGTNVKKITLCK